MKAADLNPHLTPSELEYDRTGKWDLTNARRMRRLINRLLDESPKLEMPGHGADDDQTPAMEATVTIRGLMQPISGVLSLTPEGTLKLLIQVPGKAGELPALMEAFFDYSDVNTIAVERAVTASVGSRIIQSS